MNVNLLERLEKIVFETVSDIDITISSDEFNLALGRYVEVVKVPFDLYREHSSPAVPGPESLQFRFKYETAFLHVLTRALVTDIHGSISPKDMPVYQPQSLFSWYSLSEKLCHEIDSIAADIASPVFFQGFIPNLSRYIQSKDNVHDLGEFYTPGPIVEHLLEIAGFQAKDIIDGKRVIDPACGGGIILVHIAQSVVNLCLEGGCTVQTALTALSENLYGFDVQPFAVTLTKSFLLHISSILIRGNEKYRPPDFPNIRLVDTLTTGSEYWVEAGFFDYVIGNPPFVSIKKKYAIHADRYDDALFGHPNLYQLFVWWAVKATVPNGKISFVLPQSALIGSYSKQLREKLNELTVLVSVTRMIDRYDVIEGADQQMMAVCIQVRPDKTENDCVQVRVTRNGSDIHTTESKSILRSRIVQNVAGTIIWVVSDSHYDYEILEQVETHSGTLSSFGGIFKIGNGGFVWNQHKDLVSAEEHEHSIPLISSASITPYLAVFPYTGKHQTRQRLFARVTEEVEHKQHSKVALLVQRTTPRKAGRRVVAGMLPLEFHRQHSWYFIENHVNYAHVVAKEHENLLYSLNAWLNSDIVNFVFQLRNGTAHISLFEMSALPIVMPLMHEISAQAAETVTISSGARQKVAHELNQYIFDWLSLGWRHRQRIEEIMGRRERSNRS